MTRSRTGEIGQVHRNLILTVEANFSAFFEFIPEIANAFPHDI